MGADQSLRGQTLVRCAQLIEAGQYDVAVTLLKETLAKNPSDPRVLHMLGMSLASLEKPRESIRHLKYAAQLTGDPEIYCTLGLAFRKLNQIRDSHQALDQALKRSPAHPRALSAKALLFQGTGQIEKAMELVSGALKENFDPGLVVQYGQFARQLKRYGEGIDMVRGGLERVEIPASQREELCFVLGHLYDAEGEYDKAFESFQRGNTMAGEGRVNAFDRHMGGFRKEIIDGMPRADVDASRAVFIIGMPRSGTTLTEQVIAAHPQAGGIGESAMINEIMHAQENSALTQKLADQHGEGYLKMLQEKCPSEKIIRVCDKMPENYLFVGAMIRVLPGARYIQCVRDARDTCLSIYFQRFGARQLYARDLKSCAEQYLGYLEVMEYWRSTLGIEIMESSYEDLTADPEKQVRALLGHIGLGFDPACMEHHKSKNAVNTASVGQVRSPIYKSSRQRWKNYEKYLGEMLEILDGV